MMNVSDPFQINFGKDKRSEIRICNSKKCHAIRHAKRLSLRSSREISQEERLDVRNNGATGLSRRLWRLSEAQ
jgi:hypothetical protein